MKVERVLVHVKQGQGVGPERERSVRNCWRGARRVCARSASIRSAGVQPAAVARRSPGCARGRLRSGAPVPRPLRPSGSIRSADVQSATVAPSSPQWSRGARPGVRSVVFDPERGRSVRKGWRGARPECALGRLRSGARTLSPQGLAGALALVCARSASIRSADSQSATVALVGFDPERGLALRSPGSSGRSGGVESIRRVYPRRLVERSCDQPPGRPSSRRAMMECPISVVRSWPPRGGDPTCKCFGSLAGVAIQAQRRRDHEITPASLAGNDTAREPRDAGPYRTVAGTNSSCSAPMLACAVNGEAREQG